MPCTTLQVCKAPYRTPVPLHPRAPVSLWKRLWLLYRAGSVSILDLFHAHSWAALVYRSWRTYVFAAGVCHAMRLGAFGLQAGVRLGHTLVAEQAALMVGAGAI
jgi:hypothetical protein